MQTKAQIGERLLKEWERCAMEGVPLALLVTAFDEARANQDDDVLEHLERALRVHCARDRDIVSQRADGVFVAILPDTTPPGARHVGEQIVDAMRHAPQPEATVAVGVAAVVPSEQEESAALLARAERALKAARDRGGNSCAGGSVPASPPGGALAQLRKLLMPPNKSSDQRRHTD